MSVVDAGQFRNEREAEAWQRYLDARAGAERTGDIRWGIAAGRAWREWIELFHAPQQSQETNEAGCVIQFQRTRRPRGRA